MRSISTYIHMRKPLRDKINETWDLVAEAFNERDTQKLVKSAMYLRKLETLAKEYGVDLEQVYHERSLPVIE